MKNPNQFVGLKANLSGTMSPGVKNVRALKMLLVLLLAVQQFTGRAQVATSYTFASSSNTYSTALTNQTTIFPAGWSALVANVPLPFVFYFNGKGYSSIWVNSNGYITFGDVAPQAAFNNPIANNNGFEGSVSAFGLSSSYSAGIVDANNANPVVYGTQTSGGNTVFVIQWTTAWRIPSKPVVGAVENINFQIRLVQNTNVVEIRYGTCTSNLNYSYANLYSPIVGLGGATTADFNTRTSASGAWTTSSTSAATTPSAYVFFNASGTVPTGLTMTWTPTSTPGTCSSLTTTPKAVASTGVACGSTPASLSLSGLPNVTGLTYQWHQSATGLDNSYTAIAGATDAAYTFSPSASGYYRCQVSCGASTVTSTAVAMGRESTCPTAPTYTNGVLYNSDYQGYGTRIASFSMPSGANTCGTSLSDPTSSASGYAQTYAAGTCINYIDLTYLPPIKLQAGTTYAGGTLTAGYTNAMFATIWIDFNDDGSFTGTGEQVGTVASFVNTSSGNVSITIPAIGSGAYYGLHRMRVRSAFGGTVTSPTANMTNTAGGNAKDYMVSILPPNQTIAATPIASPASICAPGALETLTATPNISTGTLSGTSYTYVWSGPGGFGTSVSSSSNATSFTPASTAFSGIYSVTAVSNGSQACVAGTVNVIVATPVSSPNNPPASGLSITGTSYQGATINFTPFSTAPDGYLIVATNSSTPPTAPVDGTTYATGASGSFGANSIVINGSVFGSAPPYSTAALSSNSQYYIYVYPFNIDCSGPKYYSGYPVLVGNTLTTCIAPPTGVSATSPTGTTINLSWTAAAAGGNTTPAVSSSSYTYTVHAYLNASLTTEAIGFPVTGITGTSYVATGLGVGTTYYFVVTSSATGACGSNSTSASNTTICTGAATVPLLQDFETSTLASLSPNCWTSNAAQVGGAGGVYRNGGYFSSPFPSVSGLNYFLFLGFNYTTPTTYANQWLMSPGLSLTPGTYNVRFKYISNSTWAGMKVQYSTTGTLPSNTTSDMTGYTTIGTPLGSFSAGSWTLYSGSMTITTAGTYYVGIDAISAASLCLAMAIEDFEICKVPTVNVSSGAGPYCATATVNLSSAGTTAANSYLWSGPSGYTSTLANPVVSGLGAGSYTYSLTAVNDPLASGYGGYCSTGPVTTTFNVSTGPLPITGTGSICPGSTLTLSNTTVPAGTWSSGTNAVATVDPSSGVVTGVAAGTAVISYTISCGGYSTTIVTVNFAPGAITGATSICEGTTGNLINTIGGGTWVSTNTTVASVNATTGLITAGTPGTSTITYTLNGCTATATATVSPALSAITGTAEVCPGSVTTLGNPTTGGAWSRSNTNVNVDASAGEITGVTAGTTIITYTYGPCIITKVATISPQPTASPTSDGPICSGGTVNLSANGGGSAIEFYWYGSDLSSPIGASTTATPTTTGVYLVEAVSSVDGCSSNMYPITVTVNNAPTANPANDGPICDGGTVNFTANIGGATTNYTWSGSNLSSTAALNPMATPNSTSVYSLTVTDGTSQPGCVVVYTTSVTVHATPTAAPGNDGPICVGGTVTLAANPAGSTSAYSWSGSGLSSTTDQNPTATPTTTSVYSLTVNNGTASGCAPTTVYTTEVTVNQTPTANPTNDGYICNGGTVTLTANPGGSTNTFIWSGPGLSSSSDENPTATPTSNSTYSLMVTNGTTGSGCAPVTVYTTAVSVHNTPTATPTNNGHICEGGTVTLEANPSGGATVFNWSGTSLLGSTSATTTATPTANAIYSITVSDGSTQSGCSPSTIYTTSVTVNPKPTANPTNNGYICDGGTVTLDANPSGGATSFTWSGVALSATAGTSTTATPNTSGIYSLVVSDGTTQSGCAPADVYTTSVIVHDKPTANPVNGGPICNGGTVSLSANPLNGATAFNWTGANLLSTTDELTTAMPTATAVYSLTVSDGSTQPGCSPNIVYTTSVTVRPTPSASPTNNGYICLGGTVDLAANPANGASVFTWSGSTLSSAAAENPSATPGSTEIYSLTVSDGSGQPGCSPSTIYTTSVDVHPIPTANPSNSGPICVGGTVILNANPADGANTFNWMGASLTSSTAADPSATPTATNVYSLTVSDGSGRSGCSPVHMHTVSVTVKAAPSLTDVTTDGPVCEGATLHLFANGASDVTDYSWSGPVTITDALTSNASVAATTIAGNGTYSVEVHNGVGAGCSQVYTVGATINQLPAIAAVSPSSTELCLGSALNLTAGTTSGSGTLVSYNWSGPGAYTAVGVVDEVSLLPATTAATGIYSLTVTYPGIGCTSMPATTPVVFVYDLPTIASVSVTPTAICPGDVLNLEGLGITGSGAIVGYNWTGPNGYSSTSTAATQSYTIPDALAGGAYSLTVTYTGTGCTSLESISDIVAINPLPDAGTLSGPDNVCPTATISLSSTSAGGTWTSDASGIASVDASGTVTGSITGTTTISYAVTNVCGTATTSQIVTVNALADPGTITGTTTICPAATTTLGNTIAGGAWNSSTGAVATIDPTGTVLGIGSGTTTISYTVTNICGPQTTTAVLTVRSAPDPGTITGTGDMCPAATTTLSNLVPGGTWNSAATGTATVNTSGVVTGVTAGTTTISYTVTNVCSMSSVATTIVTVNPLPNPGTITGTNRACEGTTTTLANIIPGGTWSAVSPGIASISASGVVSGLDAGTTTISYAVTNDCGTTAATTIVTVDVVHIPVITLAVFPGTVIEKGTTTTLTATVTGGGATPTYQWQRNGANIPGATNATYVSSTLLNNDSITCKVKGSSYCDFESYNALIMRVKTTGIDELHGGSNVKVIPNPSKGEFVVKGELDAENNETIVIEVTNMLGQVVHRNQATLHDRSIDQRIRLENIPNGMYLLNIRTTGNANNVQYIIVEQ